MDVVLPPRLKMMPAPHCHLWQHSCVSVLVCGTVCGESECGQHYQQINNIDISMKVGTNNEG